MGFLDKAKNAVKNLDKNQINETVDKAQGKIGDDQLNEKIDGVQEKLGHNAGGDEQDREPQDPQRDGDVGGADTPADDRADDPDSG